MPLTSTAIAELSAQETGTAWLVLLTIDHPSLMGDSLRLTSDSVPTISQGQTYTPYPFEMVLPDDVEGRAPRAQLRIDNITQEIVAILRGLITPPTLSITIVRSTASDTVERQWIGIEWRTSSYDVGTITGTLTIDDLANEEWPPITYDGRFPGLWPGGRPDTGA